MSYIINKPLKNGLCEISKLNEDEPWEKEGREIVGYVLINPNENQDAFEEILNDNPDWFFGKVKLIGNKDFFGEYKYTVGCGSLVQPLYKHEFSIIACKPDILK